MCIDEEKSYVLSNYGCVGGKNYKRDSDHNTLYMDLSLQIPVYREERKEIFNFKNRDCQEVFFNLTEHSTSLRDCFQNSSSIEKQGKKWFKSHLFCSGAG